MCSKEEEPLVLQQFLRFGETRPITQQLLLQEFTERQNEEQRAKAQSEIKRLIERHSSMAAARAASPPPAPHNGGTPERPSSPVQRKTPPHQPLGSPKNISPVNGTSGSPLNRLQNMQPYDYRTKENDLLSPEAASQMGQLAALQRGAAAAAAAAAAIERPVPPTISPMRMPPSSMANI